LLSLIAGFGSKFPLTTSFVKPKELLNMENRRFKFVLLTALLMSCLTTSSVLAQKTARAGVKAGMNVSNLYIGDNVHDENARIGFNGGFYGQILSSEAFAIQPELLYSTKGSRADYSGFFIDQKVRFNLNYIDLPVLAVFKLGRSAEIHAGAYASYLLGANFDYDGNVNNGVDELDRDHFKSYDYGLSGGFGLNFNAVQIGARYNYGLVAIADSNTARTYIGNSKNSVAQLYLALNLNQD
jgi:hypothetical protein